MAANAREFDPLIDDLPSRYVVGIDLGTTNSAVAYVDTQERSWQVRVFQIPQLVAPEVVESRETLPSFHYQPPASQATDAWRLPWQREAPDHAVGVLARDEGAKVCGRQIGSAKSWLSHAGVDRTADFLPWHGGEDVDRLSPVEVSARYLRHIHAAWNARHPEFPLATQDIVLTLPASFDEVARELTVAAAHRAGLPNVVLIEEPQSAFYAWVYKHAGDWQQRVSEGQKILVCDIGGGTTDFTLIRVRRSESSGDPQREKLQFHRIAVGNHLILGGDNLDLALAQYLEQRIAEGGKLEPRQWDVLLSGCRRVKEELLGEHPPPQSTVHLPGSGSRLIGGGLQVEATRDEVRALLVEGFLPTVALSEKPAQRQSGFQEFGLPYAADPAITRYLAAFLNAHRGMAQGDRAVTDDHHLARPDVVLFNGGFFASPDLRGRLLDVLSSWFRDDRHAHWMPLVLDNDRLDLAVARGAAYYGMVRRGEGVRIAASLARSYYVGVESDEPQAVCLVPGNAEPGQSYELSDRTFRLAISQPVEFPLFVSSVRLTDEPGSLLPIDREQMTPMPPIRTVLKSRSRSETGEIPVRLHVQLTEIGTIDLWCHEIGSDRSWRLQFDVRSATQTHVAAPRSVGEAGGFLDEAAWARCRQLVADVFSPTGDIPPARLVKELAKALDLDRSQWPMSLLRRIWEALFEYEDGRRRSAAHEARWLNLVGYALRPGYGLAVDDWRVTETWRTTRGKLVHHTPEIRTESMILWRRLSGGLSAGQQIALAEPLVAPVRSLHRRMLRGKSSTAADSLRPEETPELWRLLGSLELLSVRLKVEIGQMLVELLPKRRLAGVRHAVVWTLGRLGQRSPVYGPLNTVVPAERAAHWLESLLHQEGGGPMDHLAVMQVSRYTGDRYRDLAEPWRKQAVEWLRNQRAAEHLIRLVAEGGQLDEQEQDSVFGESLPKGLRIE